VPLSSSPFLARTSPSFPLRAGRVCSQPGVSRACAFRQRLAAIWPRVLFPGRQLQHYLHSIVPPSSRAAAHQSAQQPYVSVPQRSASATTDLVSICSSQISFLSVPFSFPPAWCSTLEHLHSSP
jgi:hypothetical protein